MAADYGHFADGSSARISRCKLSAERDSHARWQAMHQITRFGWNQLTPSFFCRLDDEVVYWNTSRLSG